MPSCDFNNRFVYFRAKSARARVHFRQLCFLEKLPCGIEIHRAWELMSFKQRMLYGYPQIIVKCLISLFSAKLSETVLKTLENFNSKYRSFLLPLRKEKSVPASKHRVKCTLFPSPVITVEFLPRPLCKSFVSLTSGCNGLAYASSLSICFLYQEVTVTSFTIPGALVSFSRISAAVETHKKVVMFWRHELNVAIACFFVKKFTAFIYDGPHFLSVWLKRVRCRLHSLCILQRGGGRGGTEYIFKRGKIC